MTIRGSGRPRATSHAAIEQTAFALFEERGFEATTMEDVAAAVGISRRTLFRYYPSKNDILWGRFDVSLQAFAEHFAQTSPETPLWATVREAVVAFNSFDRAAMPQHRRRMELLLRTPTLMAHSELRYAAWRSVVADHVAARLGQSATDLTPSLAGRLALAVSVSAYEQWLDQPEADLGDLIAAAFVGVSDLTS